MTRKRQPQPIPAPSDPLCKAGEGSPLRSLLEGESIADEYPPLPDDLKDFRLSFLKPPKYFISLSVPESLYFRLRRYGISKFYEEAVEAFDGDLRSLLTASLEFMEARKNRKPMDAVCNLNGRVVKETLQKIESIKDSLEGIRNMSRAKVLAGLVQLKLNTMK